MSGFFMGFLRFIDGSRALVESGSGFWREPEHNVESGGEFTDARALDRREIDGYRMSGLRVFDSGITCVALILWLTFDVTLGGPFVSTLHLNRTMNVPGAPGVKHRFNR